MPYLDPVKNQESKRRWYLKNLELTRQRSKNRTDDKRAYLRKLKEVPCMDCGIEYPYYVMEFDHREGEKKMGTLARMVALSGWGKILEEVAKCDVVCSNCHAIRTYKRGQRFKNQKMVGVAQRKSARL